MEIYIIRHGNAFDPAAPRLANDDLRQLTDEGRAEVATMARLLARLKVQPDAVLSSPLVRARQTADIVAEALGVHAGVRECADLAPGGSPSGVLHDLAGVGKPRTVVLSGHMPGVGQLVGFLAWQALDIAIPFRTAEVCRIDLPDDAFEPGAGDLRWLIPPRIARKLLGER